MENSQTVIQKSGHGRLREVVAHGGSTVMNLHSRFGTELFTFVKSTKFSGMTELILAIDI